MLDDDDKEAIRRILREALEEYGLKKPLSAAALRMQRWRERQRNEGVTKRNGAHRGKRNGGVTERNEDVTPIVCSFLLNDGTEFGVSETMVKEFEALYPQVDVPQTLREIKGWCLANQPKRKTRGGALKFVNGWLAREQNKG